MFILDSGLSDDDELLLKEASFSIVDEAETSLLSLNACVSVEQKSFYINFSRHYEVFSKINARRHLTGLFPLQ
jgi:hypothetical protein